VLRSGRVSTWEIGFELLGLEVELELLNALEEAIVIMSLIEFLTKMGRLFGFVAWLKLEG
jgi:hypothetical protein